MNRIYYLSYPAIALFGIATFALGGMIGNHEATDETIKMCQQKALECKFKYDILMYNETGKVPYTEPEPKPNKK